MSKTNTTKRNWGGSRAGSGRKKETRGGAREGAGRKKQELSTLSVRVASQLVKDIDGIKGAGSRGAWLKAAISEKLEREKAGIDSEGQH